MKKIQDISLSRYDDTIDTRDPNRVIEAYSENNKELESFNDAGLFEREDVSIWQQQDIKIDKKSGKHFDSLEKRSAFSRIFTMKDISLKKKTRKKIFFPYILSFQRYITGLGHVGQTIMILGFIVFCVFSGILTKVLIENRVNSGYERLLSLRNDSSSLREVQKHVNNARFDLLFSDILFTPFKIFPGNKIDSVEHVIAGGRNLSRGLDDILALYSKIDDFIEKKSLTEIYFTQLFLNIYPELKDIEKSFKNSVAEYNGISWLPSKALEDTKIAGVKNIEKILGYINTINSHYLDFLNILGHDKRKRYLIVFQNADEIRPTGGFMGSMGLLEIFRGRVQLFQKKDVYAIEWDLKKAEYERLVAPKGISELTDNFGLRDANYFANLKDSSKAIKFFTDRAGIDLDGIVYINQNILLHLLEITGPVYFEALDIDITAENFSELMSLVVEAKTFKQGTLGTPKQVLFDFMEVFSKKLMSDAHYFDYLQSLIHDLESRDIMMWSFHESENNLLKDIGVNGEIKYDSSLDYSYPVYTSLSGNKSDRYMNRSYNIDVSREDDSCNFLINTQIKSSHNMSASRREFVQNIISDYKLDSPNLFQIQGADRNRQFMRVILPTNAQITPKIDTEIVDYGSRKGIEFFLETPQQQAVYYDYEYILPNPDCNPYSTTFYKQAGIPSFDINLNIFGEEFEYLGVEEDFYFEER